MLPEFKSFQLWNRWLAALKLEVTLLYFLVFYTLQWHDEHINVWGWSDTSETYFWMQKIYVERMKIWSFCCRNFCRMLKDGNRIEI